MFIGCLGVIAGVLTTNIVFGTRPGVAGYVEFVVAIAAVVVLLHNVAMHMLPVARGRSQPEPGISERGPAYGISPTPGGFSRIVIHLRSTRHRRDD